jgi:glutamate---cysteine ligase / carboxylate-amine ligase
MAPIVFNGSPTTSLGIEIELGIVDHESADLVSAYDRLLEALPEEHRHGLKPELIQCCVELNSDVSRTVAEAREDLERQLRPLEATADSLGLNLWWGATHPFGRWSDQKITPTPRYLKLVELLQEMARRMITFGVHMHVGVESGDKAVMICDRIMQYLPTLLALSCSSPFWDGRDTGLHSNRSKVMEGLPTAGLPPLMRNWSEYVWLVNHMVKTGFINTIREIWWDVRPHHDFGTVEVRVCDLPGSLDDVCGLAALVQCLVRSVGEEIDEGTYQFDCHPMLVHQNKWRACRYGLQAQLVNSYDYSVESVPYGVRSLVERLRPISQDLRCEAELGHALTMAARPGWPQRQRALVEETGDAAEMVRRLCQESRIS